MSSRRRLCLEALRETITLNELASKYAIHPKPDNVDACFTARIPRPAPGVFATRYTKKGFICGRKKAGRLMNELGLAAIYRKPRLSNPHPGHKIYPYLLRAVLVARVNQVWSADITYIPLRKGFAYLTAVEGRGRILAA